MPGKVNPVLLEAVSQLYFLVSGNNLTIEHGAEGAQLELIVMLPIMTDRLSGKFKTYGRTYSPVCQKMRRRHKSKPRPCKRTPGKIHGLRDVSSAELGYDVVSDLVKEAVKTNKTIRETVLEKKLMTNKEFDAVVNAFRP